MDQTDSLWVLKTGLETVETQGEVAKHEEFSHCLSCLAQELSTLFSSRLSLYGSFQAEHENGLQQGVGLDCLQGPFQLQHDMILLSLVLTCTLLPNPHSQYAHLACPFHLDTEIAKSASDLWWAVHAIILKPAIASCSGF